jgi:hypothetical protein
VIARAHCQMLLGNSIRNSLQAASLDSSELVTGEALLVVVRLSFACVTASTGSNV